MLRQLSIVVPVVAVACSSETSNNLTDGAAFTDGAVADSGATIDAAGDAMVDAPPGSITPLAPGSSRVVYVKVSGVGKVAVKIEAPKTARYGTSTGVVMSTQTFFTGRTGEFYQLDASALGLVHVSYLWPGWDDKQTGAKSDGTHDYGGEGDIAAFGEIMAFVAGSGTDDGGNTFASHLPFTIENNNIGLFAFSHPGIAATNVMALYGEKFSKLTYFVGRENPTFDAESTVELGYYANAGKGDAVLNPLYNPSKWTSTGVAISYSSIRYDSALSVPYFDLDGDRKVSAADHPLGDRIPQMAGKYYYSSALLHALESSGTLPTWPTTLATAADADARWPFRTSTTRYANVATKFPNLKALLLFSKHDHVQPADDRPHIRHAYEGLRTGNVWVRMNPDSAYLEWARAGGSSGAADADANKVMTSSDWLGATNLAYDNTKVAASEAEWAAIAEMADRTHKGDWSTNLTTTLVTAASPKASK